MVRTAREALLDYLGAQSGGDMDEALELISADAIFDVGRGRYVGEEVRGFLERLRSVHSSTQVVEVNELDSTHAVALLDQHDDDLVPLGIDGIRLDVDVEVDGSGRIARFTARPTPESLAAIAAARDAGRTSEGVRLAERAGNLPPQPED